MGCTDRCVALRNPNGVVSSDFLEGLAGDDGFFGHTGIEFGTTGFGAWSTPLQQALPKVVLLVWGVAPSLMLTMALDMKTTASWPGA